MSHIKTIEISSSTYLFFEEFKQLVDVLLLEIEDREEDDRLSPTLRGLIYDKLFEYANVKYSNYSGTEEKPISSEKSIVASNGSQ